MTINGTNLTIRDGGFTGLAATVDRIAMAYGLVRCSLAFDVHDGRCTGVSRVASTRPGSSAASHASTLSDDDLNHLLISHVELALKSYRFRYGRLVIDIRDGQVKTISPQPVFRRDELGPNSHCFFLSS